MLIAPIDGSVQLFVPRSLLAACNIILSILIGIEYG